MFFSVLRNVSKQTLLAVKGLPGTCCCCCSITVGYWLTDASENDVIFAAYMKDYGSIKQVNITPFYTVIYMKRVSETKNKNIL